MPKYVLTIHQRAYFPGTCHELQAPRVSSAKLDPLVCLLPQQYGSRIGVAYHH